MNRLPSQQDRAESLRALPNLSDASRMLGVSRSTLSRRTDLRRDTRGDRDIVLDAAEVMRLATIYRERSLNDVAQHLLDHASETEPAEVPRIESEIAAFFERQTIAGEREELERLAERLLPPGLVDEIQTTLAVPPRPLPNEIEGWRPAPDDE